MAEAKETLAAEAAKTAETKEKTQSELSAASS